MNKYEFWNMLNEDSKDKVKKLLSGYAGSDGAIDRIYELYEEEASAIGYSADDYLEEVEPNVYIDYLSKVINLE